jgi:peptidoglycan/xylan/chitin deacetylase (PgdA/CDA1 family)
MNNVRRKEALKKALYHGVAYATHYSGIGPLRSRGRSTAALRIVMYHKVNDRPGNILSVPVSLFDEQMAYLKSHYNVVAADDVLLHVAGSKPLPPKAALITFDDGYRDVFRNAYPILQRYGLSAVLFLATDFIGGDTPFPHDAGSPSFVDPALDWDEVRAMLDRVEMGSHARSHRILTSLPPQQARQEIFESRTIIEERIERPVRLFAYPSGGPLDFDARLRSWVIEAGYQLCFTTVPATNRHPFDPYALTRYNVEPYGSFYFECLLEGSCDLWGLGATEWGARLKRALVRQMGAAT